MQAIRARDRAIALMLLAVWTVFVILSRWNSWPQDLSSLYVAGHLWQSGQGDLVYAAPGTSGTYAEGWGPVMHDLGIADKLTFPYLYPPLWLAVLGSVTTLVSPQGFANAVLLIQMPMLAAMVYISARLLRPAAMPLSLWCLIGLVTLSWTIHAKVAIVHNQPTITVSFLMLLAIAALRDRPHLAGAALALAAAIKLSPALLALVFVIDRRWRALAAFGVVGGGLGLLNLTVGGPAMTVAFLELLHKINAVVTLAPVNTSIRSALVALAMGRGAGVIMPPGSSAMLYSDVPGWIGPAVVLAALALMAAFLRVLWHQPGEVRRYAGLLSFSLIIALFGPLGWLHYYVLPLLLLPGLFALFPVRVALPLVLTVMVPALLPVALHVGALPWPAANATWIACATWLIVLMALYLRLRRTPEDQYFAGTYSSGGSTARS